MNAVVGEDRWRAFDLARAVQAEVRAAAGTLVEHALLEELAAREPDFLAPIPPPKPEMGDLAVACFPLAKPLSRNPAQIATQLAPAVAERLAAAGDALPEAEAVRAVGPYVNVTFAAGSLAAWACARIAAGVPPYGGVLPACGRRTLIEYSAPNTNKPLHLGHVRNNLLGMSLSRLLAAAGDEVIPVNLVNDRGIHIAKSMVAYERWGGGGTPAEAQRKGDHFVGDFYVRFGRELREQTDALARHEGLAPERLEEDERRALEERTDLMVAARDGLRRWEEGDRETRALWERMNAWVYAGFDATYARLGCPFRKWYFESETYQDGKRMVEEGVARGLFVRRGDGSVWAPLGDQGLQDKLLLRTDGTSVYITQDLGTAARKHADFEMDRSLYVVGSEQQLHFRMLFALLHRLGFTWAAGCRHVSYGLVTLPHGMGKLKSREGRAVDADDLLDALATLAREKAQAGGYASTAGEALDALADAIGQGALKMYLLQVGAEKNIQFDPDRTLEFEGDTGPAVQYSHARICSIARKALAAGRIDAEELQLGELEDPFAGLGTGSPVRAQLPPPRLVPAGGTPVHRAAGLKGEHVDPSCLTDPTEKALSLELTRFPAALRNAGEQLSPAPVAAFLLDLTKAYARFYHQCPVLQAESEGRMRARLHLSLAVAATLRRGLGLLGIAAPDAM